MNNPRLFDMTLKIVEAQKSSTSGKLSPLPPWQQPISGWKPSYGIYFNLVTNNKVFYYFTDLNQDGLYDIPTASCPVEECLEQILITKDNYISNSFTKVFYKDPAPPTNEILNNLHITFTRPNSGATFKSTPVLTRPIDHIEITVSSPAGEVTSVISVYPSGRIELN